MSEPILKIHKCPRCGGEAKVRVHYYDSPTDGANPNFYVMCNECGIFGREYTGLSGYDPDSSKENDKAKLSAVEFWNDRATAKKIERIVRDAIVGYNEMFPEAPNSDAEEELRQRARVAQEWLADNGFIEEPFYYFGKKEEA